MLLLGCGTVAATAEQHHVLPGGLNLDMRDDGLEVPRIPHFSVEYLVRLVGDNVVTPEERGRRYSW